MKRDINRTKEVAPPGIRRHGSPLLRSDGVSFESIRAAVLALEKESGIAVSEVTLRWHAKRGSVFMGYTFKPQPRREEAA